MINKLLSVFFSWIPLAVIIFCFSGLVYFVAQQNLRIGANDPQIQMVEDLSLQLSQGQSVQSIIPAKIVNISESLFPFIIIFDDSGNPIAGNARLDNKLPEIPKGIFAYTRTHNEDRLTWQPKLGIRSAIIVKYYTGGQPGFVLAGRSLREVEKREDSLLLNIIIFLSATLLLSFLANIFVSEIKRISFLDKSQ